MRVMVREEEDRGPSAALTHLCFSHPPLLLTPASAFPGAREAELVLS